MTKRFIIIALVLVLACGALFVSCKQDPVKDNKAIGRWEGEVWVPGAGQEGEYFNIEMTVKDDKTFEGTIDAELKAKFTGTWTASSINKGTLKFDALKDSALPDIVMNFYADETNLIAYDAKDGGEAVVLIRIPHND